jgi:predicted acylesterase/phospholipase RssA
MTSERPFRILALDGGGAKGFYSLGVLREIEALLGGPLCDRFDLIFGTSTGAIIAALLALGRSVESIYQLYNEYIPDIMKYKEPSEKSRALVRLSDEVFGTAGFDAVRTGIGIVTTKWAMETPMIFKASVAQAHGRKASFIPGFGVALGEAVQASCSAYPFFERKFVTTAAGDRIELVDGGYAANNPTLYAIADAVRAFGQPAEALRVVSVGVGVYPEPKAAFFSGRRWAKYLLSVQLLQKTLNINTHSMDELRVILFGNVPTVRISDTFNQPEMATDLFEHDVGKLNILRQRGSESFGRHEAELRDLLL